MSLILSLVFSFSLLLANEIPTCKQTLTTERTAFRSYSSQPTKKQQEDIRFIVNTLGMSSLIKIAKSKSALKRAGKRIDLVHPLHFLRVIFSDAEMRVSMYAMQSRGWVWGDFFSGLRGSLEEEANRNNLLPEQIDDFASAIGIDPNLITPSIQQRQWKKLVSILIDTLPRNPDASRYDM